MLKLGAETMLQIGIAVQFISGIWLFLTALLDFGFWSMAIGVAFLSDKTRSYRPMPQPPF